MKPDWDKLIGDFDGSSTSLVADVDCTDAGKALCEKHGVQGYPTIKWGDPSDLQAYEGGRTYDDLKKFADENLGPTCGPANLDLCTAEEKKAIAKFMKMDVDELDMDIEEGDAKVKKVQEAGDKKVNALEQKVKDVYEKIESLTKKKEKDVDKKNQELNMKFKKAVQAKNKRDAPEEKKEEEPEKKEEL